MLRLLVFRKSWPVFRVNKRNFLSNNFKCAAEWESGPMSMPLSNEMFYKFPLEKNMQSVTVSELNLELEREMLHLRASEVATSVLELTNHAVVRKLVDSGSFHLLSNMLNNAMEYGIYLDVYTGCYFLSELIHMKDFKLATEITKYVPQLNLKNALLEALSIYAIYMHLRNDFKSLEKGYVREHLCTDKVDKESYDYTIGSTLTKLTSSINNNIQSNLQTLGLIMCKKYEHALISLRSSPDIFYKEILQLFLDYVPADENISLELITLIQNLIASEQVLNSSFTSDLHKYVDETAIKMEPILIKQQIDTYEEWLNILKIKLNENSLRNNNLKRIENVKKIFQQMGLKEKQIWFFHNQDITNLEIERMKQIYPKKWFGKKKNPQKFDDEYIPPSLSSSRTRNQLN